MQFVIIGCGIASVPLLCIVVCVIRAMVLSNKKIKPEEARKRKMAEDRRLKVEKVNKKVTKAPLSISLVNDNAVVYLRRILVSKNKRI